VLLRPNDCLVDGASGDLVRGGVADLEGFHFRNPLKHARQKFQDVGIGLAVISFRVLFLVPKTDSNRLVAFRRDEADPILESSWFYGATE